MSFTGSGVSDEQHVFPFVQILPSQKFPNQRFIDRGLGTEVIGIDPFLELCEECALTMYRREDGTYTLTKPEEKP